MFRSLTQTPVKKAISLFVISSSAFKTWEAKQPASHRRWIHNNEYKAKAGSFLIIPGANNEIESVVVGISDPVSLWDLAGAAKSLPEGVYVLQGVSDVKEQERLALGWALAHGPFALYKTAPRNKTTLCLSQKLDLTRILDLAEAIINARHMITTPAEDMGPDDIESLLEIIAKQNKASLKRIVGDHLLKKNFPAIHRVGRAGPRAPRLLDLTWGNPKHPKVTIVGKGVCFDTGGLDIKPSSAMYLMRKDMAGAAVAINLAQVVMRRRLPIRLRVLVPAVDNSVDAESFRPSDIIRMRNGMTVEVGNTDAEGRLILADALTEAASEQPDILIDLSTLTGAARTAVGTEISAYFTESDDIAHALDSAGREEEDPVWRLPLHGPYEKMLETSFADLISCPASGYAGAITAALFLRHFVKDTPNWVHIDFMGWNLSAKPGRPEGGEAMALRTLLSFLEHRYATS